MQICWKTPKNHAAVKVNVIAFYVFMILSKKPVDNFFKDLIDLIWKAQSVLLNLLLYV